MGTDATSRFDDSGNIAKYLGELVGTHYSAALRAAEAYGKHLALVRDQLDMERFDGDGLGEFWRALIKSEKIKNRSAGAQKRLGNTPSHYFSDFLDTADSVFEEKYRGVSEEQRKKLGHTEHAQCLRLLRDHNGAGFQSHFEVQNKVGQWMQMIRVMGKYQD